MERKNIRKEIKEGMAVMFCGVPMGSGACFSHGVAYHGQMGNRCSTLLECHTDPLLRSEIRDELSLFWDFSVIRMHVDMKEHIRSLT